MKKLICIALTLLVMFAMTTVCFATDAAEGAETTMESSLETDASGEEDLGGAFSPARLAYAGRMTIVGLGMVFAVLALLWLVLTVFFREKKKSTPKPAAVAPKQEAPAPAPAPAPVAPIADGTDGATVAAITAAIAAMIDSDPALKSQFANGFRVVSFRPVGGRASGAKGAWNR
jgi:sodium pump decarboxylase gamma subunit